MELRCVAEAIPVALLDLPGLVGLIGIEQEVAARGATRHRESRAGIDDAGSGHTRWSEAKTMPTGRSVFPST